MNNKEGDGDGEEYQSDRSKQLPRVEVADVA